MTRERILLVDSQEHWVAFAGGILGDAGFVVEAVSTLDGALRLVAKAGGAFSLILVARGIALEDRRAFSQLAWTKSGDRRPVVVLFPTQMTPTGMSEIFRLGAFACVNKPYGRQGLLSMVREEAEDYQFRFPRHVDGGNERVAADAACVEGVPGEVGIANRRWGLELAPLAS